MPLPVLTIEQTVGANGINMIQNQINWVRQIAQQYVTMYNWIIANPQGATQAQAVAALGTNAASYFADMKAKLDYVNSADDTIIQDIAKTIPAHTSNQDGTVTINP